jgi:hypothetical protein
MGYERAVAISRYRLLYAALASLCPLLAAVPAMAGGNPAAEDRRAAESGARMACLAGDYNSGVAILARLFVETRNPIYIFNQGRCFEQNLRFEDAVGRFEEFLRTGETLTLNPEDRIAAEKHIADCKLRLSARPGPVRPEPVPSQPPAPRAQPDSGASARAPASAVVLPPSRPEASTRGKGLLTAGIVVGSVGVAALVGGVLLNLKVNSTVDEMQNKVGGYTSAKDSDRKNYETAMWASYGIGGACLMTSAILIAIGTTSRSTTAPTSVAIVPSAGPGRAGLALAGGF